MKLPLSAFLILLVHTAGASAFDFSIAELSVPDGAIFEIPNGTSKVAFSNLVLGKNSQLIISDNTQDIEIVIDRGTFQDNSLIIQKAKNGAARNSIGQSGDTGGAGANIKISVNHANFAFSKFSGTNNDSKFSIVSTGGQGGKSGPGAAGGNASTSNCGSIDNGYPAKRGDPGVKGGTGGSGGNITAIFKLVKGHPAISDKQIYLDSHGGAGGIGGDGGAGGGGSSEKCCGEILGHCTWKRGGYSPAGIGDPGANGPQGKDGVVNLKLEFEH